MKGRYDEINLGENAPRICRAVVEIPEESRNKYELQNGFLTLDRVLHSPLSYPMNYGFLPRTVARDGDHLDALVWSRFPLNPVCIVEVKTIGVLKMRDEAGEDNKIIGIILKDPFFKQMEGIDDVPEYLRKEISQFFRRYKELEENKETEVGGWGGKEEAIQYIVEARKRYTEEHSSN